MSLREKLAAFRADFEAGKPPYNAPEWIHEPMHRGTAELVASGAAAHAKKVGETATYSLPNGRTSTVEILEAVPYAGS